MPQLDYNLWKWRALYRRRLFFFSVLQAVLILNWLTARRISHHTQSWGDEGRSSTGYRKFYEDLPILFYISHALLLATVLLTKVGRNIVHESQGKRLCDWSAFSLVLALIYHLVPLNAVGNTALTSSRDMSFTSLSLLGVALFQHLGVSEPVLSATIICVMVLWVIFLSCVHLSTATIISLAIIVLAFGVLSRMQESEFQRAFEKQRDALQGSSYGSGGYIESIYDDGNPGLGALAGMGFGSNMSLFMEDALSALRAMEAAINLQEELLNREDLLLECEFNTINANNDEEDGDQQAPLSASAVNNQEQETVTWKLTPHAASLKVNKMLCQSLFQAVASGEDQPRVMGTSFSFNKVCNQLFALFESVCGNALTLYANETVSEVLISAPKSIFELIIFLLIHDAVNADDHRICCLSCETSFAHGWHISIQSLSLERYKEHRFNAQGVPTSEGSTASASSAEGLRKIKGGGGHNMITMESFNIGRNLLLNENVAKRNRPMERIAERLTSKYLKSVIHHVDPEYRAGVRVEQKIIPLTSDRCMLAPTHESLTFARSQASQAMRTAPAEREALLSGAGAMGGPLDADPLSGAGSGHQYGRPNEGVAQDLHQWLFVVQRSHDLEGMGEIKERMKTLLVPCRVKALSELRDPALAGAQLPFAVMLIDETFLSKLQKDKDKSKLKFLRGLHLKWVVVSDPKKPSSSTDIKVLYGIDGDSLSAKASMTEVFDCVQMVTQKLPPRTAADAQSAFDDSDEPEAVRLRAQPSAPSMPSFGARRGPKHMDRSDVEAIRRWLLLVRQFKAVASKLPGVDGLLLNGLDARMKDIESLRDVHDNLEGLLAVPSYSGPLAEMVAQKKKAKYIMDTYQPLLHKLKAKTEGYNMNSLQSLAATCAVQSSTLGLLHLSAWFTTLQEIVSITVTICDTRDVSRPGDSTMADKSVSFSFTSAGKALTARNLPSSGAKAAATKPVGVGGDLMTLDDVSEHSQSDSDSNGASARAVAGADTVSGALSPTAAGAHASSQSQGTDFSKLVDPGLYTIIKEMVAAIEVAVWDAAMHH